MRHRDIRDSADPFGTRMVPNDPILFSSVRGTFRGAWDLPSGAFSGFSSSFQGRLTKNDSVIAVWNRKMVNSKDSLLDLAEFSNTVL